MQLSQKALVQLREALKKSFYLQLFVDDLPVWGQMGKKAEEDEDWGYTHFNFTIRCNGNNII